MTGFPVYGRQVEEIFGSCSALSVPECDDVQSCFDRSFTSRCSCHTDAGDSISSAQLALVEVMWGRWFSGDAFGLGHSWCRSRTAADSMVRLDALELLRLGQDLWTRVPTIRDAAGSIDIVASAGLRDLKASRV